MANRIGPPHHLLNSQWRISPEDAGGVHLIDFMHLRVGQGRLIESRGHAARQFGV
jgi:hypothetical protein